MGWQPNAKPQEQSPWATVLPQVMTSLEQGLQQRAKQRSDEDAKQREIKLAMINHLMTSDDPNIKATGWGLMQRASEGDWKFNVEKTLQESGETAEAFKQLKLYNQGEGNSPPKPVPEALNGVAPAAPAGSVGPVSPPTVMPGDPGSMEMVPGESTKINSNVLGNPAVGPAGLGPMPDQALAGGPGGMPGALPGGPMPAPPPAPPPALGGTGPVVGAGPAPVIAPAAPAAPPSPTSPFGMAKRMSDGESVGSILGDASGPTEYIAGQSALVRDFTAEAAKIFPMPQGDITGHRPKGAVAAIEKQRQEFVEAGVKRVNTYGDNILKIAAGTLKAEDVAENKIELEDTKFENKKKLIPLEGEERRKTKAAIPGKAPGAARESKEDPRAKEYRVRLNQLADARDSALAKRENRTPAMQQRIEKRYQDEKKRLEESLPGFAPPKFSIQ